MQCSIIKGALGKQHPSQHYRICWLLKEKRFLVVDLDPQANTSGLFHPEMDFYKMFLNIWNGEWKNKETYSIEDALMDPKLDIHKCIIHKYFLLKNVLNELFRAYKKPYNYKKPIIVRRKKVELKKVHTVVFRICIL